MPPVTNAGQTQPERREDIRAGFAILREGDLEGAREIFTALLEEDANLASAHVGLGRVSLTENNPEDALEHSHRALLLQPDMVQAHFLSGEAWEKLGDVDQAVASYDAALKVDPSMGISASRKAKLLMRSNNAEDAAATLSEATRRNPHDVGLHLSLASALGQAGKADEAEAEYRRAVELAPKSWFAHFGLGASLLRSKKHAEATEALTAATTLEPENPKLLRALAAALAAQKEHAKAADAYEDVLRLEPSDVRAMIGAAKSRSANGQHTEALEILRRVGRMGNRIPPVQKALGDIYFAMHRYGDAVSTYRAMILNSQQMGSSNPELVELAKSGGSEEPDDVFAATLKKALEARTTDRSAELRGNPEMRRERLQGRRGQR
ncbi:MAG: tetratricopeptide repeat protein [Paracoccaceae bacterium]